MVIGIANGRAPQYGGASHDIAATVQDLLSACSHYTWKLSTDNATMPGHETFVVAFALSALAIAGAVADMSGVQATAGHFRPPPKQRWNAL